MCGPFNGHYMRTNTHNSGIVDAAARSVKAKLMLAGIPQQRLARRAGLAPSTLCDYLAGRRSNLDTQWAIYFAFCKLTATPHDEQGFREFWGPLLNKDAA